MYPRLKRRNKCRRESRMPRNREDHSNPMNGRNGSGNKKPGMNMKKVFAISFCIVLGIVFISGGVIYKLGHDLYSSVNYVADDDVKTVETLSGCSNRRDSQHRRAYRTFCR